MPSDKPQLVFPLICDDIRQEIGNKFSLMGIYGDHIVLTKFPFTFPRFCCQVHLRDCPLQFTLDIFLETPTERLSLLENFKVETPPDKAEIPHRNLVLNISHAGVAFLRPGNCRLQFIFNGEETSAQEYPFQVSLHRQVQ